LQTVRRQRTRRIGRSFQLQISSTEKTTAWPAIGDSSKSFEQLQ
jgi:hypothetical protein